MALFSIYSESMLLWINNYLLKPKYWKFPCNPQELEIRQSTIYVIRWFAGFLRTSVLCGRLSDFRYVGTNHEVEGRNTKCRLLFLRQTIMVKGFVSKKAGSHKLKAFSRAREVALISNPWCYGMHQLFLCTVCTSYWPALLLGIY